VVVKLSGASREARTLLAVLDDPLPAGFEVETVLTPPDADPGRPPGASPNEPAPKGPYAFLGKLSVVSVQEKRDDRYVAALHLAGGEGFAVAYVARAVTPGDFFLPGAVAADMYRPAVNAHTAAARTRITGAR
jgi:uncharacterized protein YfaS (alpha-2-macroglobulin family)